jgi:hypothetical protein
MLTGVNQQLAVYMLTGGKNSQWFFAEVPKWVGKIKGYGDLNVMLVSQPVMLASTIGGNFPFIPIASTDNNLISDYTSCDYTGQSPDLTDFTYVRWVGVQWFRNCYGSSTPCAQNITSGWMPLRTAEGQAVTYGLGGIILDGPYSAVGYLGPWYSNIDVYRPNADNSSIGGTVDVFLMYRATTTQLTANNSNYGFSMNSPSYDSSDIATSRGQWEFADSNYSILSTWEGYSKLRPV